MRLINLIPLQEIDFASQKGFDAYNKQHKLRPDTKVKIAGKTTTAGQASKVKGTSVFGGGDKKPSSADLERSKKISASLAKRDKDNYDNTTRMISLARAGKIGPAKSDASLNGTSALNKSKPEDLVPSVTNHLNKVSGGDGFAQIDDGSGAIIYNMGDGDMPTYTLYMGKEGSKHRVSLEPTYGNDPKKLQGKIDKSFDNPKDAIKFMGDVAKRYRKELEMDDSKKSDTSLSSMIPNKATQKYDPATGQGHQGKSDEHRAPWPFCFAM